VNSHTHPESDPGNRRKNSPGFSEVKLHKKPHLARRRSPATPPSYPEIPRGKKQCQNQGYLVEIRTESNAATAGRAAGAAGAESGGFYADGIEKHGMILRVWGVSTIGLFSGDETRDRVQGAFFLSVLQFSPNYRCFFIVRLLR
jgi:hypothetical protein